VNLSYSGIIASAGNTGSQTLVKQGSGTLSLNGTSTFTGTTQVSAGTLAGTGTLASGLTINSGGTVAPGNAGVGTLTFGGDLTLNTGGALNLDLAAPGTSDLLTIGGIVSASGTTTVNLTGLSGFADGTYTLISASAPINASTFATGTIPAGKRGIFSSVGNTLSVTISDAPALTALETWRLTNFGSSANSGNAADAADPDFDGLPNLIEYATGTNPTATGTSVITPGRNGNFLTLTYTRIADTSLTYTVEGTSDLATWTTVTTTNNPSTGAQNLAGQVVVEDTVSIAPAPGRRFLHLKVSR
jgi:autotransporter-associated beta strand protein